MRPAVRLRLKYPAAIITTVSAITIALASTVGAATASATQPVTADRWMRSVCREVSTWLKARGEFDSRTLETLGALTSGSLSAKAAKTRLSRTNAQGVSAADRFIKEVKAAGTPRVNDGKSVARSYLKTLAGYSDAYKQARRDLARAKITNKEQFASRAQEINGSLGADLAAVGVDPVEELRAAPELGPGISASCGDVASYLMTKIDQPCQTALSTARHLADVDNQQDAVPAPSAQLDALLDEEQRAFGQLQGEFGACNVPGVPAPCRKPFEDSQHLADLWNQFYATPSGSPQEEAAETEVNRQYDVLRTDLPTMCR